MPLLISRWVLQSGTDAEDAAQQAMPRSYRFFHCFYGGDVRLAAADRAEYLLHLAREESPREDMTEFDEELHGSPSSTPEALAIVGDHRELFTRALKSLPPRYREVLVLRELEQRSYKDCHHYFASDRHTSACPPAASTSAF